MRVRRLGVGVVVVMIALSACSKAPIDDKKAGDAVHGLPGVERAAANCQHPLEGYECTLDVHVTAAATEEQIAKIVATAGHSLTDKVGEVRVLTGKLALVVAGVGLPARKLGAHALVTMRGLEHVTAGEIDFRSQGEARIDATTDSLDAGLDIVNALRTADLADVTVRGDGLQLTTNTGVPIKEFEFVQRASHELSTGSSPDTSSSTAATRRLRRLCWPRSRPCRATTRWPRSTPSSMRRRPRPPEGDPLPR
jgi:hypothetical protein